MKFSVSRRICLSLVAFTLATGSFAEELEVNVKGLGLFRNASYERRLSFLDALPGQSGEKPEFVNIEDTAYIILQLLKREGFPHPRVEVVIQFASGAEQKISWTLPFEPHDERTLQGQTVSSIEYNCEPGLLNYYNEVHVEGVDAFDSSTLHDFFIPSGILFTNERDRAFTEANLESRLNRLLAALRNEGFQKARVVNRNISRHEESGAVDVELVVDQGPLHRVGEVRVIVGEEEERVMEEHRGQILNTQWQRNVRQGIHNGWYEKGYPDSTVRVERLPASRGEGNTVFVDVVFHVTPGEQVTLAGISFKPEGLLQRSVLRRQVKLKNGSLFNLLQVEEGRRRLLSLGVLDEVQVEQQPDEGTSRSAVYTLSPLPSRKLTLSVGWGSYELGRVGAKWEQMNMWGRAHRYELKLKQSFKSTNVDGRYIVPQFFDDANTAYFQSGYEFREEIDHERSRTRFVFGVTRNLEIPGMEVSLEYAFENQDTTRGSDTEFDSLDRATVSSLSMRAVLDRRDNVIYPTEGFDVSLFMKTASEAIGGQANFHKTEVNSTFHKYLGSALYFHTAFKYGIIFSDSPVADNLPFNERFFPGGENSIRGFRRGEAAPVTETGKIIGAESYAFLSVELEQRIFRNYSLVLFWDGVVMNQDRETLPEEEFLNSVGLGIRWRTPVGPVRFEYGHNLNPRFSDPDGTFHFAVGYPF